MTTSVKIKSHNYPAFVTTPNQTRVLWPEDGEVDFSCSTNWPLTVVDIDYEDPRAVADREKRYAGKPPQR